MTGLRRLSVAFALFAWCAQCLAAAPATPAAVVTASSALQVVLGLVLVLALVGASAWLLKRLSSLGAAGSPLIRVVGAAAVGQRERVVLVEVGGTWLLVGVAPGQVRALHTMPGLQSAPDATAGAPVHPETTFSAWLRRLTDKRRHD